jgi:hypothetical protein
LLLQPEGTEALLDFYCDGKDQFGEDTISRLDVALRGDAVQLYIPASFLISLNNIL